MNQNNIKKACPTQWFMFRFTFQLSKDHLWMKERFDQEEKEDTKLDVDPHEAVDKRIMEWAKELQSVSEVRY